MQKETQQEWSIKKLREHPRQQELVGDVSDAELQALADDMESRGLQHPVEILPDGTIIAGHQRVKAARRLKMKTIPVIVRHDLAEAGETAIETHLIVDNLRRRQMSQLARAKAIRSLLETKERENRTFGSQQREQLKTAVGEQLGLTARSVSRYLLLCEAPPEVQQAYERGDLSLVTAGGVATLSKAEQAAVVQRLSAGEKAGKVVREVLAGACSEGTRESATKGALRRLVYAIRRDIPQLESQLQMVSQRALHGKLSWLKIAHETIAKLIERAETVQSEE